MKNSLKWCSRILICIMLGIAIWYLFDRLSSGNYNRLAIGLATFPVLLVPYLIKKLFHYEMSEVLTFVYYLFVFCSLVLGSVLNWYSQIGWFDLFTHFLSGILTSFVALIFLKKVHLLDKKYLWFQIIFTVCFTLAIACLWEFWEFSCDTLTGGDTQKVLGSGVTDTMTDMLIAFAGCILYTIIYTISMLKMRESTKKKVLEIL